MIRILQDNLANKIAAGEVIERPASILKELLENSIDSGALNITVTINDFDIRVDDDGYGMSKEDLELSILRFATSKIKDEADLYNVQTFGFRGEALPSIAAISKMKLASKYRESTHAYKLEIEGGKVIDISEFPLTVGTSIEVKDLFFNTPVRLKFLKSYNTEFKYMLDVFERAALSSPLIHFKLLRDNKVIYDIYAEDLKNRFEHIVPKNNYQFVHIDLSVSGINVKGYIASLNHTRPTRDLLYIYINKRPIFNNVIQRAIIDGCRNLLERGKYPIVVIFLDIPNDSIDVNVHPRKLEVRFKDSSNIFNLVRTAVNKSVMDKKFQEFIPRKSISQEFSSHNEDSKSVNFKSSNYGIGTKGSLFNSKNHVSPYSFLQDSSFVSDDLYKINVYQLYDKFLILEKDEGIEIIDQHAASERVRFEEIKKNMEDNNIEKQQLLIPYSIELSKKAFVEIKSKIDILKSIGLDIEIFGDNIINVTTIPIFLKDSNIQNIIYEIIDDIENGSKSYEDEINIFIATIACHSSIRFGDHLDTNEMQKLVIDLRNCEYPFTCPHGRPTTFEITRKELYKKFKRN
ncbi:MAG: DNA mismatch repair endonuclease MutL [Patescibacteria group bacterium]